MTNRYYRTGGADRKALDDIQALIQPWLTSDADLDSATAAELLVGIESIIRTRAERRGHDVRMGSADDGPNSSCDM